MTLYAANVLDVAKPVGKPVVEKKGKKSKNVVPEEVEEPTIETTVKKEMTEKQLAAIERRKRKREEILIAKQAEAEAIKAKEQEIKEKEEEIARKKEEAKEKRRLAREAKKETQEISPPPSSESSESVAEPKTKKLRKQRDEMEPPAWFQKYVAGVKAEEAKQSTAKVPKREVMQEAKQTAQQQWNDGLTRDRVQNEVDSHMSRMYGMIFSNRRFK